MSKGILTISHHHFRFMLFEQLESVFLLSAFTNTFRQQIWLINERNFKR